MPEKKDGTSKAEKQKDGSWWAPAIAMFLRISGWILLPLLISTTIGRWLDNRYHTEPWIFLASTLIAFCVSIYVLIKTTLEEIKKIGDSAKEFEQKQKNNNQEIDKKS